MSPQLMFWNIQNVYEYKTVTPEELKLEATIVGEKPAQVPNLSARLVRRSQRIYSQSRAHHREVVVKTIQALQPDLLPIVEFCVGKSALVTHGSAHGSLLWSDHWGAEQYLVSLDWAADEAGGAGTWQCATSAVNASDLLAKVAEDGQIQSIPHRNSMFELYAILWNTNRLEFLDPSTVEPLQAGQTPRIQFVNQAVDGSALSILGRWPGWAMFREVGGRPFVLIMVHSIYGKGSQAKAWRQQVITEICRSDVVTNAMHDDVPLVVAGDFNLDFDMGLDYTPFSNLVQLAPKIGNIKSTRVHKKASDLKNAYDQVFSRGFRNNAETGGIFDFAAAVLGGDYDRARRISDHLPAYAKLDL